MAVQNRDRLPKLIDDVWEWEEVDSFLGEVGVPRFEKFLQAVSTPCICQGRWLSHIRQSLYMNNADVPALCHDVMVSLREGRSESASTVTLVGRFGGEGKSLFFGGSCRKNVGKH